MHRLCILSGLVASLCSNSEYGSAGVFVMLFSHLFKEMKCRNDLRQRLLVNSI
jgi:hypothetical protein